MSLELKIKDKKVQLWNEATENFDYVDVPGRTITLEHSLVSLSKWEAKYKRPFIDSKKTEEEVLDYIKMMTITQNVPEEMYKHLDNEEITKINDYIVDPMTATKFYDNSRPGSAPKKDTSKVTSELIYYWMTLYNIPESFQKWHLNRLMILIRICRLKTDEQNGKSSKMSRRDIIAQNRAINAARKQKLGTNG